MNEQLKELLQSLKDLKTEMQENVEDLKEITRELETIINF